MTLAYNLLVTVGSMIWLLACVSAIIVFAQKIGDAIAECFVPMLLLATLSYLIVSKFI